MDENHVPDWVGDLGNGDKICHDNILRHRAGSRHAEKFTEGSWSGSIPETCWLSKSVRNRCQVYRAVGTKLLRYLPPDVAVVKTIHTRQSGDSGVRRRPSLRRPDRRCVPQPGMDALGVVVGDIVAEQAPQICSLNTITWSRNSRRALPIAPARQVRFDF